MREYIKWIAAGLIILTFLVLGWINKADAQQLQYLEIDRKIRCFVIDDNFQKMMGDNFIIKAAGAVQSEGHTVMSLVLITKDNTKMALAEMVDSSYMCLLSESINPRYVNAKIE